MYEYVLDLVLYRTAASFCTEEDMLALRPLRGPQVQLLRILSWAKVTDPVLREELLTQWLCGRGQVPVEEELESSLARLLKGRTPDSVQARLQELRRVVLRLPDIVGDYETSSSEYAADRYPWGFCPALDELTEEAVFSPIAAARREAIRALPEASILEEGDSATESVYTLLWFVESEQETRELIEERILACLSQPHPVYEMPFIFRCGGTGRDAEEFPICAEFSVEEQELRHSSIASSWRVWRRSALREKAKRWADQGARNGVPRKEEEAEVLGEERGLRREAPPFGGRHRVVVCALALVLSAECFLLLWIRLRRRRVSSNPAAAHIWRT